MGGCEEVCGARGSLRGACSLGKQRCWPLGSLPLPVHATTTSLSSLPAAPEVLHALLSHLADGIAQYAIYQADSGADMVMLFDSWSGQLPPKVRRGGGLPTPMVCHLETHEKGGRYNGQTGGWMHDAGPPPHAA